ncbi:MAG: hypothetical protein WCS33_00025 [Candidatus Caldatribacteriota bacterium]
MYSCSEKIRFDSEAAAKACILDTFLIKCKVYKCNECGGWHIGRVNAFSEWKERERKEKEFK